MNSVLNVKEGLSAIAREVLADVQNEAEALIVAAQKDAARTLRAAKDETDTHYLTTMDQAAAQAMAEKRRITSLTDVEMRNELLQSKESLIDAAFEKAQSKLTAFTKTNEYHEYLLKLIGKTAKKLGSKNLTVYVNNPDKTWLAQGNLEKLAQKLRLELTLADQAEPIMGGCRIQTADGKVVFDNTLENRLQELKPMLRVEVARILFGKEAQT